MLGYFKTQKSKRAEARESFDPMQSTLVIPRSPYKYFNSFILRSQEEFIFFGCSFIFNTPFFFCFFLLDFVLYCCTSVAFDFGFCLRNACFLSVRNHLNEVDERTKERATTGEPHQSDATQPQETNEQHAQSHEETKEEKRPKRTEQNKETTREEEDDQTKQRATQNQNQKQNRRDQQGTESQRATQGQSREQHAEPQPKPRTREHEEKREQDRKSEQDEKPQEHPQKNF